jgi:hypothetical protein
MKEEFIKNKISKYKSLISEREPLLEEWQKIAEYFVPQKANILRTSSKPSEINARIFDTTGIDALLVAAGGLMSWTTPKSSPWFSFSPTGNLRNNTKVQKWLSECTALAQEYLANSNFYTVRHESIIDKLAFGTSCIYSQWDDKLDKVFFSNLEVGTYVISENYHGMVDTVMVMYKLNARQSVGKFGFDNLPDAVKEDYNNNVNKTHDYLHIIEPRDERDVKVGGLSKGDKKPFASIYIHMGSQTVVKESGYDSMPMHCGRWLEWNGLYHGWGYGPGFTALPEARQLNYYQKMLDIYMGKATFPPMLVPDSFEGILDTQAKGINYYNAQVDATSFAQLPVLGNLEAAFNRITVRKDAINSKFHTDLWQMIAKRDQQKTATEVQALLNEKIEALSPAFDRDTDEIVQPMLIRLFNMWASKGKFPIPPEEAIISVEDNMAEIPNPSVEMTSKLALAIKASRNFTADQQMMRIANIASFDPSVFDNVNLDKYVRMTALNSGFPADILNDEEQTENIRNQRAQAAQQQQAAMMMNEQMKAAPDNVKEKLAGELGIV